jgi:hypothetical protein
MVRRALPFVLIVLLAGAAWLVGLEERRNNEPEPAAAPPAPAVQPLPRPPVDPPDPPDPPEPPVAPRRPAPPERPPETRTLHGVVLDEHGDPAAGAYVWLSCLQPGVDRAVRSGEDGSFSAEVPYGEPLLIDANLNPIPGYYHRPESIRVTPAEDQVTLHVRRGRVLRLRLAEKPDEGRRVTAVFHGDPLWDYRSFDRQGELTVFDVPEGATLDVYVRDPEGGRYALLRDLEPSAEEVLVTLRPGLCITGRVRGPEGSRPFGVTVSLEEFPYPSKFEPDGTFSVHCLPPGEYRLQGSVLIDGERESASRTVQAGEENVEIVVEGR